MEMFVKHCVYRSDGKSRIALQFEQETDLLARRCTHACGVRSSQMEGNFIVRH